MSLYKDSRDDGVITLIITPSYVADVSVSCISDGGIARDYDIIAYSAAQFLYNVRGLPNDCIEIETPEKIYSATKSEKDGKVSVYLQKCKVLCAKRQENVDGIDLNVSLVSYKNRIYKLTRCAHAEHFSDSSLRTLLRSGLGDSIDGASAYSHNGDEVLVRYLLSEDASASDGLYVLLAVATAVFEGGGSTEALTVKSDNLTLSVGRCPNALSVCDEKCEIYTLNAPDDNFI